MGDVDLLHHDTKKNQRTARGSGDQRAFLGALVAMLGAQEHCRKMKIGDVNL